MERTLQSASVGAKTRSARFKLGNSLIAENMSMYQDKTLVCKDSGQEFAFTAGGTGILCRKGLSKMSRPAARTSRDGRKANRRHNNGRREMHDAVCADCG